MQNKTCGERSRTIQSIEITKLIPHPDNPNKMNSQTFTKLVRNIERTGKYEPLIVRPHPEKKGFFQLINGHHRCKALSQLGFKQASVIAWDIDDEQTDIFLATLNRLGGSDDLNKKLLLLKRLTEKFKAKELGKFLPQTAKQIEQLANFKMPAAGADCSNNFLTPLVFFVTDEQKKILEDAIALAEEKTEKPKAVRRAAAITKIAKYYTGMHQNVGVNPAD